MKKFLLSILLVVAASVHLKAQKVDGVVVYARVINGDTIPIVPLDEINIYSFKIIDNKREARRHSKLVRNVKKVYPYALIVREKFSEINDTLQHIEGEKARKQFLKDYETNLFGKYEDDIKHMTITQGRILIKLIDRETQNTSYQLIRDYRGSISAFFWQGIARIFGSNLKSEYEPHGEDYLIEKVIYEIEQGRL